jgi:hypothetical protein
MIPINMKSAVKVFQCRYGVVRGSRNASENGECLDHNKEIAADVGIFPLL